MPLSNDNQDYGMKDNKDNNSPNKGKSESAPAKEDESKLTTDNLKGKKVDADPETEKDKPADV